MQPTDAKNAPSVSLLNLAQIQAGYMARGRIEPDVAGTYRLLQWRDVVDQRNIHSRLGTPFIPERNPELYRLSRGDMLIAARGDDQRARFVPQSLGNMLASNVFHIVRPDARSVVPEYLCWWLNQPFVQSEIRAGATGSAISYIKKAHIEKIGVLLPSLAVQQKIVRTIGLWDRRHKLQLQLDSARQNLIHAACLQAARTCRERK